MAKRGGGGGTLLKGLKKRSPSVDDASRKPKGGSVRDNPTRSEPGEIQEAPGPRNA